MTKDEIISLLKKNPISAICGLISIGLVAGIYFRSDEVPAAEEELAQKSEEGGRYAANLHAATQLKEQFDALETCQKELDTRLVHASQQLTNYQYFYKLESDTGAKMTALAQSPMPTGSKNAAAKGAFISVPFTITVQGTLAQIEDYLRRLESGARYCRVLSVTCSVGGTDRSNAVTLAVNLELLGKP